jgi:hypothetical protein
MLAVKLATGKDQLKHLHNEVQFYQSLLSGLENHVPVCYGYYSKPKRPRHASCSSSVSL